MNYYKIILLYRLLGNKEKKALSKILVSSLLHSIVDLTVLSTMLPLMYIITHQDVIHSNKYLKLLYDLFEISTSNFLIILFLFVLMAFAFRGIFSIAVYFKHLNWAYQIGDALYWKISQYVFHLKIPEYRNKTLGEIDQMVRTTPYQLASFVLQPIGLLVTEILVILFLMIGIIVYNITLFGMIVVFVFLPAIIIYSLLKRKIYQYGKNQYTFAVQNNNISKNILRAYPDIYITHQQNYFIQKLHYSLQKYNMMNQKISTIQQSFPRMIEWVAILSIFIIFLFSVIQNISYAEMGLTLTVYFASAYRIIPSINRINASMMLIKQYEHIVDIFKEINDRTSYSTKKINVISAIIPFEKTIKLENISVSYSKNKKILDNLNLIIYKGEMLGIVGESGAGKSTLIYTIAGMIDIDDGKICVDDMPIENSNIAQWHKHIAVVFQEPYIIDGNWIDNICFGQQQIDEERIWTCLKLVQLDNYVKELPQQLKENIGDSGAFLSGGQKQRLALARALYRDADVLLLDEATSALDEQTQTEVMDAIENIRKQRNITVIIIAHRYSSLRYCQRIVSITNGKIEKIFSYSELMKTS